MHYTRDKQPSLCKQKQFRKFCSQPANGRYRYMRACAVLVTMSYIICVLVLHNTITMSQENTRETRSSLTSFQGANVFEIKCSSLEL